MPIVLRVINGHYVGYRYATLIAGTPPPSHYVYTVHIVFFFSGETGSAFFHTWTRVQLCIRAASLVVSRVFFFFVVYEVLRIIYQYVIWLTRGGSILILVDYCNFLRVPDRHKITNPLIPQQPGVIPMPTGSHF